MPDDHFIRELDMVLELCFVSSGYAEVLDGKTVKFVIRSDVDSPSIVGEISFFSRRSTAAFCSRSNFFTYLVYWFSAKNMQMKSPATTQSSKR